MYYHPPNQSAPLVSLSHSLDFRVASSNCDQVQGSHFTKVEEWEGEYDLNISYLFHDPPCQDDALPFLDDFQSSNLSSE